MSDLVLNLDMASGSHKLNIYMYTHILNQQTPLETVIQLILIATERQTMLLVAEIFMFVKF